MNHAMMETTMKAMNAQVCARRRAAAMESSVAMKPVMMETYSIPTPARLLASRHDVGMGSSGPTTKAAMMPMTSIMMPAPTPAKLPNAVMEFSGPT